jgi:hypothetical protein
MLEFPGLTVIHPVWEGPMPIEEAFGRNADTDFGLYAIYGTHPNSGPDTLLYVGQSNMAQFGGLLRFHNDDWGRHEPTALRVCLGRVGGWVPLTDERWGELIVLAERVTIHHTRPPCNAAGIRRLAVREFVLVLNHRRRHRLPLAITNIPRLLDVEDGIFQLYGTPGYHPKPSPDAVANEEPDPPGAAAR